MIVHYLLIKLPHFPQDNKIWSNFISMLLSGDHLHSSLGGNSLQPKWRGSCGGGWFGWAASVRYFPARAATGGGKKSCAHWQPAARALRDNNWMLLIRVRWTADNAALLFFFLLRRRTLVVGCLVRGRKETYQSRWTESVSNSPHLARDERTGRCFDWVWFRFLDWLRSACLLFLQGGLARSISGGGGDAEEEPIIVARRSRSSNGITDCATGLQTEITIIR